MQTKFQKLGGAINNLTKTVKSLTVVYRTNLPNPQIGVDSVSCDYNKSELVVGGGCYCSGKKSEGINYGILFGCSKLGNGWQGGCNADAYFFDPKLPYSPVVIEISCLVVANYTTSKAKIEEDNKKTQESLDRLREMVKERELALRNKQ